MNIHTEYNAGYYIAELDEPEPTGDIWGGHWYPDVDDWCEQTFGKSDLWGEEPQTGWKRMRNKFYFTEEKLMSMFVLRWS